MPYTRNDTEFYKITTDETGKRHKLVFWPATTSTRNITQSVEFPDWMLLPIWQIDVKFNDYLPIGMPSAGEMKLKIDISQMEGEWSEVRDWIMNDNSYPEQVYSWIFGRNIYIPNVWLSFYEADVGGTPTWTLEFIGGQSLHSSDDLIIREDYCEWEITVVSLDRLALESITLQSMVDIAIPEILGRMRDREYNDANIKHVTSWLHPAENYDAKFILLSDLISIMSTMFDFYCTLLTRESATGAYTITNNPLTYIQCYKQTNDKNNLPGDALDSDYIYIIRRSVIAGTNPAEYMEYIFNSDDSAIGGEYGNCWDFFDKLSEGFLQQFVFKAESKSIAFYPVFGGGDIVITAADIYKDKEQKITRKFNISGATRWHVPKSENGEDEEIIAQNGGAYNDKQFETAMIWTGTGMNLNPDEDTKTPGSTDYNLSTLKSIHGLYYAIGAPDPTNDLYAMQTIDEKAVIVLLPSLEGLIITQFDDSVFAIELPVADGNIVANWIEYNRRIYPYTLDGLLAKTALDLFGNINQYLVPIIVDGDYGNIRYLGTNVEIDLANIFNKTYLNKISKKGKIVGINKDNIKGTSELQIFVRGDKWV
jgi:hypothetical protein